MGAKPRMVRVLDEKTKQEMWQLHEADPSRWTAAALAVRFGAAQENANAVLRLGALRTRLPEEHIEAANDLQRAWVELGALSGPTTRGTAVRNTIMVPSVQAEARLEDDENDDFVGTTETAQWAREVITREEFETLRKSTFAFIEVGKGLEDNQRAVWLRDGGTGLLRAPTKRERARLLDQRRVVE